MDIKALRARLEEINAERAKLDEQALARDEGQRDFNEAEQARWDELTTEHDEVKARLATAEAAEERRERIAADREKWRSTHVVDRTPPASHEDVSRLSDRQVMDRFRSTLDNDEIAGHLDARQKDGLLKMARTETENVQGEQLARFALATSDPHYRSAFQLMATGNGHLLEPEQVRAVRQVRSLQRAMSLTDGAGGYAVPTIIDPTVIPTAQGSPNDILRLARVETITVDTWRGLASAGVTWSWHAESAAATDNSPTITQPEVATYRTDGFIPYSIEISMDWASFAENMVAMLGDGFDENLAQALTLGAAASTQPTGLVVGVAAVTASWREVATAGTIAAADVYATWDALPARWRKRSKKVAWMSSTDVQNSIRQLGTTDPNFTVDLGEEDIPRMFNREYPTNDYMQDDPAGTGTQPLLVVGDFQQYLVAMRAGMTVEYIPHLFDVTNNRPTGQRGFFAWARVGAGVLVPEAFRLLRNKSA